MDLSFVLVDFKPYRIDLKDFVCLYIYAHKSSTLVKCFIEKTDSNIELLENLLYEDISKYLSFDVRKDGSIKLVFDYK